MEKVPIEENLGGAGDEMDIDDDGTQRPKEVADWGVEPDFETLEDDDKEVSICMTTRKGDKLRPAERERRSQP